MLVRLALAAGGDDREDAFDEAAAGFAVGAEARLPPQHCVAQRPFGGVVLAKPIPSLLN